MTTQLQTQAFEVKTQCRRYEGQVAIVTGAAQGLGRVIARRLAEEGADVMLADIQGPKCGRTAEELAEETGSRVLAFAGDLSQPGVADALAAETQARLGRIDVLVNNAAVLIRMPLEDFTEDLLQEAVNGNMWNTLRTTKAVVPYMQDQRYGRIVNIAGEAWRMGTPGHTLLGGIGKGGMVGLTACLAGDLVREGVTVNCVSPGGIETQADGSREPRPATHVNPRWTPPETQKRLAEMGAGLAQAGIGMGRLAHPTEIAAAVAFLGSREASFTTGQHLGVSGGIAMI
jgi:NAD(P)-dependent dehydrogenase (short-subunit alcohol dehydrogenase family)